MVLVLLECVTPCLGTSWYYFCWSESLRVLSLRGTKLCWSESLRVLVLRGAKLGWSVSLQLNIYGGSIRELAGASDPSTYLFSVYNRVRPQCSSLSFNEHSVYIFRVWVLPTLVTQVFMTLVIRGSRLMPCSVFQRKVLLAPLA